MTKKEFILRTAINLASNPVFIGIMDDGDTEFPCLKFEDLLDNATGLAEWIEENEEENLFDEEGN